MKLAEYREAVGKLERGEFTGTPEALAVNAGLLAWQLETALWYPGFRAEAAELAGRAREFQRGQEALRE